MKRRPEFRLVPLAGLLPHEEIRGASVRALAAHIRKAGVVDNPIWVAEGSGVILNGHHRVAALRSLGAEWAPAWVLPYDSDLVRLERWDPGPPIDRSEVVRRATANLLYTPKTTRHILAVELPHRVTPLSDLLGPRARRPRASRQRRASPRSPASGTRAPGSG